MQILLVGHAQPVPVQPGDVLIQRVDCKDEDLSLR